MVHNQPYDGLVLHILEENKVNDDENGFGT